TGAERVWVTHGYREPVVRWLREHGLEADAVASRWEGEADDADAVAADEAREEAEAGAAEAPGGGAGEEGA
ncbi:MAG TPA: hypothetical protein VFQ76_11975, partial [Longimicrobiaceae bacterium]|nr:hypothetical protein [Longimicrobiaceae bacterium]